jgi:hypothetical protein
VSPARFHRCSFEPACDGHRIEPNESADFHKRDAPLGHEAPNVPFRNPKVLRDAGAIE